MGAALGVGALGVGALAACSPPWSDGPAAPTADPSAPSPDRELLERAIAEVTAIAARVEAAHRQDVAPRWTNRFNRLHAEHLSALVAIDTSEGPSTRTRTDSPTGAPSDSPTTVTTGQIITWESAHVLMLELMAGQAVGGSLARLLTSLAAAVAQELKVIAPDHPVGRRTLVAPSASARDKSAPATAAAMQQVLAGEHAAMFVGAVLAARAPAGSRLRESLEESWRTHRELRDQLEVWLHNVGELPVAAAADYALPTPLVTDDQLRSAALEVQGGLTDLWAAVVGHSVPGTARDWAVGRTHESAVRELDFGGRPEAFPGAEQLTYR